MHCEEISLIIRRPLNITEFGDKARKVLYACFLYINAHGWVLTLIDSLTRLTLLTYTKTSNAEVVVDVLWKWHSHFILADEFFLVTDQGSHFVNTVVTKFLKESNGLHKMTIAYIIQTAGTVEVQNKSVLKNLRSLVSEFGLKEDQWPLQGFLNSNLLTCRGYPNKSNFELIYGEDVKFATIGSGNLKVKEKDLDLLKQKSAELSKKIADYQDTAYKKDSNIDMWRIREEEKDLLPFNSI
eukprot:snap_masked-scaffold_26-processed-gene-3.61-mRNA-1 protein AED:1.00 eAED:1.00 QI:0/0/0/0/1/1/2/0/239